ncbi:isochorismatase family hydrolase [Aspergillus uvarum CBS 121591]|uniref:Isochorismatase family hydrolase n=1 Tax=Aspergillus uvarum CBS 121591 TaxID=1448315 RepID=A0A319DDI8_9EURO|nr:isochorismatase family hydrolase [Aspergillus uvarum CBS 121591]PYH86148.1 isochorismatase family hydrolase [Aspergillus uvarum CBS 121591]
MASPTRTALLLIDIQQGFSHPTHWGTQRSTPQFEQNVTALLAAFRTTPGAHVLHVCHHSTFLGSPLHPSKPGADFMPYARPIKGEPVFSKTTNSPFIETGLADVLRQLNLQRLVIIGLMTAHCVSTTLRAASNLRVVNHGYGCVVKDGSEPQAEIILVQDATATFNVQFDGREYDAEAVHAIHLATMKDEFCDVTTTADVLGRMQASGTQSRGERTLIDADSKPQGWQARISSRL